MDARYSQDKHLSQRNSLKEAIERIVVEPAPVLLLDACSMLDIVRAPLNRGGEQTVRAAVALTSTEVSVWLVLAEVAEREWHNNLPSVVRDCTTKLVQLEESVSHARAALAPLAGAETAAVLPSGAVASVELLRALGARMVDRALRLDPDERCRLAAGDRVAGGYPPSRRGKEQYTDCEILEHYLELARQLRAVEFDHPVVFVSSNTIDYGKPPQPREPLAREFQEAGIEFTTTLDWALAVLGRSRRS